MRPFPAWALRDVARWIIQWAMEPGPAVAGTFAIGDFNQPGVQAMAQGFVGQQAQGTVTLEDADPHSQGATYEAVTYDAENPDVAAVAANPDDPLKCTVLLLAAGSTRVMCHVDPGQGEALHFAVDVEAQLPPPGEAVGGTFDLGAFEQVQV